MEEITGTLPRLLMHMVKNGLSNGVDYGWPMAHLTRGEMSHSTASAQLRCILTISSVEGLFVFCGCCKKQDMILCIFPTA